jgi:hypothetical protein
MNPRPSRKLPHDPGQAASGQARGIRPCSIRQRPATTQVRPGVRLRASMNRRSDCETSTRLPGSGQARPGMNCPIRNLPCPQARLWGQARPGPGQARARARARLGQGPGRARARPGQLAQARPGQARPGSGPGQLRPGQGQVRLRPGPGPGHSTKYLFAPEDLRP